MGVQIHEAWQEEGVRVTPGFASGTRDVRAGGDDTVTPYCDGTRTVEAGFGAENAIGSDQEIVFIVRHE
jgi:hypothetical protein